MAKKIRQVARSPEDLAKKRDLILDAAMGLLHERGYTKTTISDIAAEAHIGRGTVYWHFESKDDLFFGLVKREVERMEAAWEPLLGAPGHALGAVDALAAAAFAYYKDAAPLFHAFMSVLGGANEAMEHRLAALLAEAYGQYNQVVADLLERGKEEGQVRLDLDSEITAAAIIVLLDAMFLQVGFGLIPNDPDRLTTAVTSLIHHGCVPCATEKGADNA